MNTLELGRFAGVSLQDCCQVL